MFQYLQVQHTTTGDVLGQTLTYNTRDEWLLEYHTQMKNAINNSDVIGMSINVLDNQLNSVFKKNWVREVTQTPEQTPEPEQTPTE